MHNIYILQIIPQLQTAITVLCSPIFPRSGLYILLIVPLHSTFLDCMYNIVLPNILQFWTVCIELYYLIFCISGLYDMYIVFLNIRQFQTVCIELYYPIFCISGLYDMYCLVFPNIPQLWNMCTVSSSPILRSSGLVVLYRISQNFQSSGL